MGIVFREGEKMTESTEAYHSQKPGFFIFPADTDGNNARISGQCQFAVRKISLGCLLGFFICLPAF